MTLKRALFITSWMLIAAAAVGSFGFAAVFTGALPLVTALVIGGIALVAIVTCVGFAVANLSAPKDLSLKNEGIFARAWRTVKEHRALVGGIVIGTLVSFFVSKTAGGAIVGGSLIYDIGVNRNGILALVIAIVTLVFFLSAVAFIPGGAIGLAAALVCMIPCAYLAGRQLEAIFNNPRQLTVDELVQDIDKGAVKVPEDSLSDSEYKKDAVEVSEDDLTSSRFVESAVVVKEGKLTSSQNKVMASVIAGTVLPAAPSSAAAASPAVSGATAPKVEQQQSELPKVAVSTLENSFAAGMVAQPHKELLPSPAASQASPVVSGSTAPQVKPAEQPQPQQDTTGASKIFASAVVMPAEDQVDVKKDKEGHTITIIDSYRPGDK